MESHQAEGKFWGIH